MANYSTNCPKLPWLIDFYSSADGKIPHAQLKAAFAENYMDYLTSLNIDSQSPKKLLTSIMCTTGPACNNLEVLEKMMKAGMRVMRINMNFYTADECKEVIKTLQKARNNYSRRSGRVYPLTIAVDIKGADIRTGLLKDPQAKYIELQGGNTTNLTADPAYTEHVTPDMIYVDYQKISDVVEPGDNVYLDDGKVVLSALEVVGSIIRCLIENTGSISNKARVSLPDVPVDLPFLSEKDIEDLKFCTEQKVDMVIVPISTGGNVDRCREALGPEGKSILIFARIYSVEGIHNIDDILKKADGIILIRSKLSLDLPQEKMFLAQKSIIAKCNKLGIPLICAPQMLESMTECVRPTTAELNDIANTIIDGADGILLSKETSIGKYPVETVETLAAICKEAEAGVYQREIFNNLIGKFESPIEIIESIALSAVEISLKTNAAVIVVTTTTGRTAKLIAKYRPRCSIVAVTRLAAVARHLHLYRAVDPLLYLKPVKQDWNKELMRRVQLGITYAKMSGFVRAGDAIVIVISPKPGAGFTNSIKVVYASEFDALPPPTE